MEERGVEEEEEEYLRRRRRALTRVTHRCWMRGEEGWAEGGCGEEIGVGERLLGIQTVWPSTALWVVRFPWRRAE